MPGRSAPTCGAGPVSARRPPPRDRRCVWPCSWLPLLAAATPGRPVPVARSRRSSACRCRPAIAACGVPTRPDRPADAAHLRRAGGRGRRLRGPARARGLTPAAVRDHAPRSGFDGWLTALPEGAAGGEALVRGRHAGKVVVSPPVPPAARLGRGVHPVRRPPAATPPGSEFFRSCRLARAKAGLAGHGLDEGDSARTRCAMTKTTILAARRPALLYGPGFRPGWRGSREPRQPGFIGVDLDNRRGLLQRPRFRTYYCLYRTIDVFNRSTGYIEPRRVRRCGHGLYLR